MSDGSDEAASADAAPRENDGRVFDRLPATDAEREVAGRPSRAAVVAWWRERYGVPADTWSDHTFWEKGAGKVWALGASAVTPEPPVAVEALGLPAVRARQEHWKPTMVAAQRWGHLAERNVIELRRERARRFLAGEDQEVAWDGDWGYLLVAHELGGARAVLGVGLYLHGELRSQVPKGRRRDL